MTERERAFGDLFLYVNTNMYCELIVCIGVIIVIETSRFVNKFENLIEHLLHIIFHSGLCMFQVYSYFLTWLCCYGNHHVLWVL